MPMRGELACRAKCPPPNRNRLLPVIVVLALINLVLAALRTGTFDPGLLSSTYTVEEQWLIGP
jgi:hypothetical protein